MSEIYSVRIYNGGDYEDAHTETMAIYDSYKNALMCVKRTICDILDGSDDYINEKYHRYGFGLFYNPKCKDARWKIGVLEYETNQEYTSEEKPKLMLVYSHLSGAVYEGDSIPEEAREYGFEDAFYGNELEMLDGAE